MNPERFAALQATSVLDALPLQSDVEYIFANLLTLATEPELVPPTDPAAGTPSGSEACRAGQRTIDDLVQPTEVSSVSYADSTSGMSGVENALEIWTIARYGGSDPERTVKKMLDTTETVQKTCASDSAADAGMPTLKMYNSDVWAAVAYGFPNAGADGLYLASVAIGPFLASVVSWVSPERADLMLELQVDRLNAVSAP